MLTRIRTSQIQTFISSLVGDHRTCGIPGRTIQTNIAIARSVRHCSMVGDRVVMLQIYLEKAFDHLRHDVHFCNLDNFGRGSVIFRWVQMECNSFVTKLNINRYLWELISVRSTVRQGSRVSPLFSFYFVHHYLRVVHCPFVDGGKVLLKWFPWPKVFVKRR